MSLDVWAIVDNRFFGLRGSRRAGLGQKRKTKKETPDLRRSDLI